MIFFSLGIVWCVLACISSITSDNFSQLGVACVLVTVDFHLPPVPSKMTNQTLTMLPI